MLSVFSKLFNSNESEIKNLQTIVSQINSFEDKIKKLKDSEFSKKTKEFKERIEKGETLDAIIPEAFALVREAARRTIGQRHFDVQMMAAIALAHGKIAEQRKSQVGRADRFR